MVFSLNSGCHQRKDWAVQATGIKQLLAKMGVMNRHTCAMSLTQSLNRQSEGFTLRNSNQLRAIHGGVELAKYENHRSLHFGLFFRLTGIPRSRAINFFVMSSDPQMPVAVYP
jgi:hypothetical protein